MNINLKIEYCITKKSMPDSYLKYIPLLKNCNNWADVEEISFVNYQLHNIKYYGLIVQYLENYYFLQYNLIRVLSKFRKWNLEQKIKIVSEKKKNSPKITYNEKYVPPPNEE